MKIIGSSGVLQKVALPSSKSVTFTSPADEIHKKMVTLLLGEWEDMGSPEAILVTIQATERGTT